MLSSLVKGCFWTGNETKTWFEDAMIPEIERVFQKKHVFTMNYVSYHTPDRDQCLVSPHCNLIKATSE